MDPLTITRACVRLLSSIADLTVVSASFVAKTRDARRDVDAVQRELSSLSLCVESLKDDFGSVNINLPSPLLASLVSVLVECDEVVRQILDLLDEVASSSVRRHVQWAIVGRNAITDLRFRLVTQKTTLDIALDAVSLSLLISAERTTVNELPEILRVKQHPNITRKDTSRLHEQAQQLLDEISTLKAKLRGSPSPGPSNDQVLILQRFLDQSTVYAVSLIDREESVSELGIDAASLSSSPATSMFSSPSLSLKSPLSSQEYLSPLPVSGELEQHPEKVVKELEFSLSWQTSQSDLSSSSQSPSLHHRKLLSNKDVRATSPYTPARPPGLKILTSNLSGSDPASRRIALRPGSTDSVTGFSAIEHHPVRSRKNTLESVSYADVLEGSRDTYPSPSFQFRSVQEDMDRRERLVQIARANRERLNDMERQKLDASLRAMFYSTLTYASSKSESLRAMNDLLIKGADVSAVCEGNISPSLRAVVKVWQSIEHTALFWDYGAPVDELNSQGGGALYEAVECGEIEIVRFLLARGVKATDMDADKTDPIIYNAILKNRQDIAMLLIQNGIQSPLFSLRVGLLGSALNAAAFTGSLKLIDHFLREGIDVDSESGPYGTPLMTAIRGKSMPAIKQLVDHGANINKPNFDWGTALHLAALHPPSDDVTEIVKYLLRQDAGINIQAGNHHTALHAALYAANDTVVALLLENGADPNIKGRSGRTTLMTAALSKPASSVGALRVLLMSGATIASKAELNTLCTAVRKASSDASTEQAKINMLQECYKSINSEQSSWWGRIGRKR